MSSVEAAARAYAQGLPMYSGGVVRRTWAATDFKAGHAAGRDEVLREWATDTRAQFEASLSAPIGAGHALLEWVNAVLATPAGQPLPPRPRESMSHAARDVELQAARELLPRIVCLCGSSRFRAAHDAAAMAETLAGRIVVGMGCFGHDDYPPGAKAATCDGDESTAVKQSLDQLHLHKIDLADEVLVLNVGGYIGSSTRREVRHALAAGKLVRFLEPIERACDGHEPWHCDERCYRAAIEWATREQAQGAGDQPGEGAP